MKNIPSATTTGATGATFGVVVLLEMYENDEIMRNHKKEMICVRQIFLQTNLKDLRITK
jgi:hypothetical protein